MPATTSTRATLGDAASQDQNFDSGRGLPWGTRTRSCGISSGWHYCRQALWCRLLFWNTGMGYAAVASGNWSVQSSLQQGYAILAACPNRTMQFPSASPSSNVDIPMNYLSLTHLWRIPGLLPLLCAHHLQLRQWFAWCAIFTLLCFLLHLLRRRVLIYFSAGLIQPKQISLLLLAFRQWNWLRRSFGLSRATDQSGLPMTWLVPFFVPLLLAAEPSVGRYKSDSWSHSHRFAVACDL